MGSAAAMLLTGVATAQDDCTMPTAVGVGTIAWDTTGFTDSTFAGVGGGFTGTIGNDQFFLFTVPADGDYTFDTCGGSGDTELALYAGADCTATFIDSNDDFCALQSRVDVPGLVTGDQILIQAGSFFSGIAVTGGLLNIGITVPPPPAPANNDCATPTAIGLGVTPWDSTGTTNSGFGGAAAGLPGTIGNDLFYTFTIPADDTYIVETCGGTGDTEIAVYLGADCSAVYVDNNDDDGLCGPQSSVDIVGLMGEVYLIQVGHFIANAPQMDFYPGGLLTISVAPPPPPAPANNDCSTPTAIAGTGTFAFDSFGATDSGFDGGNALCDVGLAAPAHRDVFFAWTAPSDDSFVFDTYGTTFNTVLSVHAGADCSAVCIGGNDQGPLEVNGESEFQVNGVLTGDVLLVAIGEWDDDPSLAGPGVLNITVGTPPPPPPANDDCSTPTAIMGVGAFAFDNTFATTSGFIGGGVGVCDQAVNIGPAGPAQDLFWAWTATADGDFRFETCGSGGLDTVINLHTGADCTAVCLQQDDDGCGLIGAESQTDVFGVLTGDQFLVQLGDWDNSGPSGGAGTLTISVILPPPPPPANDDCSTPEAISGEGTFLFDNTSATTSGFNGGEIASSGGQNCYATGLGTGLDQEIAFDVFFAWTATCDGDYVIDTLGSVDITDTKVNIHTGDDCSALCLVANDDNATPGDFLSEATITGILAGETYLIQVGTFAATSTVGMSQININRVGMPCAADGIQGLGCPGALPHSGGTVATLATSTYTSGGASGLVLQCTDGLAGEFGFYLVSTGDSGNLAIFNGVLCLDSPQGRYNPNVATNQGLPQLNSISQFDPSGVLQLLGAPPGTGFPVPTELPFAPGETIDAGEMFAFQCWYREGSSANFSDSLRVQF